jgi:glyoxylase-like metal-dependent hydrolase (beta-lactamase superfamily II)
MHAPQSGLTYPYPAPGAPGELTEVAPGILWFRLALPFLLDHVNIYLIEDGEGWALIDTGLGDRATARAWDGLINGALKGRPITRIIVTHFHPDHVGSAGWLLERFDVALYMSATEYLLSLNMHLDPGALEAEHYRQFYRRHGLDDATTENVVTKGHEYLRIVSGLPKTYRRLIAGDVIKIGGRRFEVLTGGGHSPEQIMLLDRADKIFFAADQVLAKISPNVSVAAVDPAGDPLGIYLRSLGALKQSVPEDVLVLPGHQLPFVGLHLRAEQLERHHLARCAAIAAACRTAPRSAAELIPSIFERALDAHQTGFAFSEVLAHVNYMLRRGELSLAPGPDAVERVAAVRAAVAGV